MGFSYDPKYGMRRIDHSCGASRGDIVKAYGDSYKVISKDDYGCFVCVPLADADDYESHQIRTFDDLDIDEVIKPDDPRFTACGAGI